MSRKAWCAGSAALLVCGLAGFAVAKAATPWQTVKTPAPGPALSIGEYSAGCLQGARELPQRGEGYRVVRPARLRHFGHPLLVDFVQTLGRAVQAAELEPLRVGDLSQPRGGRAPGVHASHQTGLDADLWYTPAARGSVLDAKRAHVQTQWVERVQQVLHLAVSDARVSRVFVNPVIKRDLCAVVQGERDWLTKIRPWYGHDAHFHVRLLCPPDSSECKSQDPLPAGDGCGDDLAWWFSAEARQDRAAAREKYQSNLEGGAPLPAQCDALIAPTRRSAKE